MHNFKHSAIAWGSSFWNFLLSSQRREPSRRWWLSTACLQCRPCWPCIPGPVLSSRANHKHQKCWTYPHPTCRQSPDKSCSGVKVLDRRAPLICPVSKPINNGWPHGTHGESLSNAAALGAGRRYRKRPRAKFKWIPPENNPENHSQNINLQMPKGLRPELLDINCYRVCWTLWDTWQIINVPKKNRQDMNPKTNFGSELQTGQSPGDTSSAWMQTLVRAGHHSAILTWQNWKEKRSFKDPIKTSQQ